jgi:hypothetical protein
MDRTQADAHITRLGDVLGLAGLALDEQGLCLLALDGGALLVKMGYQPQSGSINLMVCLDKVVPTPVQMADLLAAHFGWAHVDTGVFAIEPGTGALVLQRRCGDGELDAGLYSIVDAMVNVAERWRDNLAAGASPLAQSQGHKPFFPLAGRV